MTNHSKQSQWQTAFAEMIPEIQGRLGRAFRNLDVESREDAVQEGVIHSLLSYVRLCEQGRENKVSASTLAWFAAMQVKHGRPAFGRMSVKEPLSRYAQIAKGIRVDRLDGYSQQETEWIASIVADKRSSVVDQVAAKLDLGAWFATLTKRLRLIARDLAFGCSTSEVARKHGVSPGRISQLRRKLEESWAAFQHDAVPAALAG